MWKKFTDGLRKLLGADTQGYEQLKEHIRKALALRFPAPYDASSSTHRVEEVYEDRAIICDLDGNLYEVKYTVGEGGAVTLAPELLSMRMEVQYIAQQSFGEPIEPTGSQWEVVIIRAGTSKTNDHFPVETLQAAIPLFEGSQAFALSQGQHVESSMEKPVKDIIGWYDSVRMAGDKLVARLNLLQTADWLRLMLVDLSKKGKLNLLGISVDIEGSASTKEVAGQKVRWWSKFVKLNGGGDIVWDPAAGGAFVKALAAGGGAENTHKEEDKMKEKLLKLLQARRPDLYAKINVATVTEDELSAMLETAMAAQQAVTQPTGGISEADSKRILQADARLRLSTALADSKLPEPTQAKVRNRFKDQIFEDAALQQAITEEREYLGKLTESGKVQGFGETQAEVTEGEADRLQMAFHKLLGVTGEDVKACDIAPFTSIRQAYVRLTGDKDVRGFVEPGKVKLQQAISSASWPNVLANTLHRKLLQDYREPNYGERNIITTGSAPDFRTREAVRIGYFADLAVVDPEVADYPEMAAPGDEKVSYAVATRGGILTITRKTIINDDLRAINKMVGRVGRAARRTFSQFCWNFPMTNPALDYDATAWFHANHGNLGSTALSAAAIEAALILLADMTELGSNKKLGLNFNGGINSLKCWLVVPNALFGTASKENMRETLAADFTPNPVRYAFGQAGERIIVNPLLTDANDWYIFRDPSEGESIYIDFLGGQEEPELFLADNPVVGQMFVGDKLQYKIRHEYGGDVVDHRGAFKAVVA